MLRIDYVDEHDAVCWRWIPPAVDLETAKAQALRGFAIAQQQFGAVAVIIFDEQGERFQWKAGA